MERRNSIRLVMRGLNAAGMNMELIMDSPIAASFSIEAKPESVEPSWVYVADRLPDDGEPVQVMLERSREVRIACRGHYQSTSAWFDAQTHTPIYETIVRWKGE